MIKKLSAYISKCLIPKVASESVFAYVHMHTKVGMHMYMYVGILFDGVNAEHNIHV